MNGIVPPPLKTEHGMALLLTMAFILTSLSMISLIDQRVQGLFTVVQNEAIVDQDLNDLYLGAGAALALLETGRPPADDYKCLATVKRPDDTAQSQLSFSGSGKNWTVTVSNPDPDLEQCPPAFGGAS